MGSSNNLNIYTHPSSVGMDKTVVLRIPIFIEKLWDGYAEEEWEPSDHKVSHAIHVCELKKW